MTGFGRASNETCAGHITIELKSVNHRYLDISLRMPRDLSMLEEEIKSCLRESISRGRLEVSCRLQAGSARTGGVSFNHAEVNSYIEKLKDLSATTGLSFDVRLEHLLSLPGVIVESQLELDESELLEQVKTLVRQAASALLNSREAEGAKLAQDIAVRLDLIFALVTQIEARSNQSIEAYRQRLQDSIARLASGITVDPARLEQEVVLFAERSSITEELVRLNSHLQGFKKFLALNDAVGRKMDFYVQEMNRETNTIGSKSADVGISQLVVEIKSELEKIREQVQNIE